MYTGRREEGLRWNPQENEHFTESQKKKKNTSQKQLNKKIQNDRKQKSVVSSEAREESLPRGNMKLAGSNGAKVNIEKSLGFNIKLIS